VLPCPAARCRATPGSSKRRRTGGTRCALRARNTRETDEHDGEYGNRDGHNRTHRRTISRRGRTRFQRCDAAQASSSRPPTRLGRRRLSSGSLSSSRLVPKPVWCFARPLRRRLSNCWWHWPPPVSSRSRSEAAFAMTRAYPDSPSASRGRRARCSLSPTTPFPGWPAASTWRGRPPSRSRPPWLRGPVSTGCSGVRCVPWNASRRAHPRRRDRFTPPCFFSVRPASNRHRRRAWPSAPQG
jgi:hypothetical protein